MDTSSCPGAMGCAAASTRGLGLGGGRVAALKARRLASLIPANWDAWSVSEDIDWALSRLREFEADATPIFIPSPPMTAGAHSYKPTARPEVVLKKSAIVEQILDKYTPTWRDAKIDPHERYRFRGVYEAAQRCIAVLEARDEIEQHLVDHGPALAAEALHTWVWEAARPSWESGLYEDAVDAAARSAAEISGKATSSVRFSVRSLGTNQTRA